MKIILDTDPGIDDAMAYYFAHASENIDLIGITTVFGNVTIDVATHNALWLAESVKSGVPVHKGNKAPLSITPNPPSSSAHGDYGFGEIKAGVVSSEAASQDAAEFLVSKAAESPGQITVCAVGPLTNIACAIEIDPYFIGNLRQLVIMGGSLHAGGNVTEFAEANFWNDPHAAHAVLNAQGGGEIVIVGLDVTRQIAFYPSDFEDLEKASPKTGRFLKSLGDFYMKFYESVTGELLAYIHDPAALVACERPELFTMQDIGLSVVIEGERIGEMVEDTASLRTCKVCMATDQALVVTRFKSVLANLD